MPHDPRTHTSVTRASRDLRTLPARSLPLAAFDGKHNRGVGTPGARAGSRLSPPREWARECGE